MRRASRQSGLTLIELIIGLAVTSMLMVGLASVILVASHALPVESDDVDASVDAARVMQQIMDEVRTARELTSTDPGNFSFTIDDRDGDSIPEVITYSWSGASGAPLLRQYNSGTSEVVVDQLVSFSIVPQGVAQTTTYSGKLTEEAGETELEVYDPSTDLVLLDVTQNDSWGQFIQPRVTPDTVSYRVTRALAVLENESPTTAVYRSQLHRGDVIGATGETLLEETDHAESALPSTAQWQEFSFAGAHALSLGEGVTWAFVSDSSETAVQIVAQDQNSTLQEGSLIHGNPDFVTRDTNAAMRLMMYGKRTTKGPDLELSRVGYDRLAVVMQVSDDVPALVGEARLMKTPAKLSFLWACDFTTDPTVIDRNGDGTPELQSQPSPFDTNQLADGEWTATQTLFTYLNTTLEEPTIIDVSAYDSGTNAGGPVIDAHVDWTSSTTGQIRAVVRLEADNTQTVAVSRAVAASTYETVVEVTGLDAGPQRITLITDGGTDSFHLRVNGQPIGTYGFDHVAAVPDYYGFVALSSDGDRAEFADLRIEYGGTVSELPNVDPQLSMSVSHASAVTGQTVTYNASGSSDSDGDPLYYTWDFGDGAGSHDAVATHAYTQAGTYTIKLYVSDRKGALQSGTTSITVN